MKKNAGNCVGKVDAVLQCSDMPETAIKKYDEYYDDVPVADLEQRNKKKVSTGAALRVGLVVFGLLISVAVCITVMWLV